MDVNILASAGGNASAEGWDGGGGGALTLLVDSEKLQNFASTSRLVNFSL